MWRGMYRPLPALAALTAVMGCAGNGEGLDANGQPIIPGGNSGGAITADFQSIQDNVFTPICSKCHIGASAPEGLELDAAHSYNLLVGVPSVEQPGLERVNPGNPDQSYMVLKIEGAPGIQGGQMPLGETPLPEDTINAIRQWISNGAPKVGATSASAAEPFALETSSPRQGSVMAAPLERIVVTFSHELDATSIGDSSVRLERLGETEPRSVPVHVEQSAHNTQVMLVIPLSPLSPGQYRATVRGAGEAAFTDLSSRRLGADRSFEFSVESLP